MALCSALQVFAGASKQESGGDDDGPAAAHSNLEVRHGAVPRDLAAQTPCNNHGGPQRRALSVLLSTDNGLAWARRIHRGTAVQRIE